ncbi:MAG: DUF6152 family protein [Steroidobacteraceae bacterium]
MRTAMNSSNYWAALLVVFAPIAVAHHSFAMFDQTKPLTLKGTVGEFQWTNPHAFIHLNVVNRAGKSEMWVIELNSPNNLKRQGWKANMIKTGDRIKAVISPLRTGHGGLLVSVTLPNGKVLGEPPNAERKPINVPNGN